MHSTNSYLYTLLERIRSYLDLPEVDAKYSNDYLVRHIICPAQTDVMSRLSHTSGSPVLLTMALTLTGEAQDIILPPNVLWVLRIETIDEDGNRLGEVIPRSFWNPYGTQNWRIEGSPGALVLHIDAAPSGLDTAQIIYQTNGDILPHYGTGTLASGDTVTLAATPTLGVLDRRPNAYVGSVLRILSASGPIEERQITAHAYSGGNWTVTARSDFTYTTNGSVLYEIAPAGSQSLYEAIAAWSALKIGTNFLAKDRQDSILLQYRAALKTIGDNLTYVQSRVPSHYERKTADSEFYQPKILTIGTYVQ